ncbi:MAG: DinB family protein, partial [Chitinophagaceae bacterium]
MPRPNLSDVPSFYHNYINQVQEDNVLEAIANNGRKTLAFFQSIPPEKWDHRYAEGKWSIKELLQH